MAPNGTFYGAKAEVVCNKGYQIEGSRTILCSIEGQWSEQLAKCVPGQYLNQTQEDFIFNLNRFNLTVFDEPLLPTTLVPLRTTAAPTPTRPSVPPQVVSVTTAKQRPTTTAVRRPTRPSTRFTTLPTRPPPTTGYDVDEDDEDGSPQLTKHIFIFIRKQMFLSTDEQVIIPGTVREEFPPKPKVKPFTPALNGHANNSPPPLLKVRPLTSTTTTATTKNPQNIILAAHPQDNEIASSVNIRYEKTSSIDLQKLKRYKFDFRSDQSPNVNIPFIVEDDPSREAQGAKLNLGAIVALSAFSGFVFLAAVIGVIVCMVKK